MSQKTPAQQKKHRLRPWLLLLSSCLITQAITPAWGLGLYASYLASLKHNKPLMEAQWRYLSSQDANDVALSVLKPSVNATLSGTAKNFRTKLNADATTSLSTQNYNVTWTQALLDKVAWYAWKQAKEEGKYDLLSYLTLRQTLIVDVAQSYTDLISATENLSVVQQKKRWVHAQLKKAEAELHSGLGLKTTLLQLKAEYQQAQTNEITATNNIRLKQAAFAQLTGKNPKWLMKLSKTIVLPKLPNQKAWYASAKARNLTLKQAEQQTQIAHMSLAKARAEKGPSLSLSTGLNHYQAQGDSLTAQPLAGYTASAELTLSMPLYSGGRITAATRMARKAKKISEINRDDTEESINLNLKQTYLSIKANEQARKTSKAWLQSSRAAFIAENARFSMRSSDIATYLASLNAYEEAALKDIELRYQHIMLWLELKQLAGVLNAKDLKTISQFFHKPVHFPKDIE